MGWGENLFQRPSRTLHIYLHKPAEALPRMPLRELISSLRLDRGVKILGGWAEDIVHEAT